VRGSLHPEEVGQDAAPTQLLRYPISVLDVLLREAPLAYRRVFVQTDWDIPPGLPRLRFEQRTRGLECKCSGTDMLVHDLGPLAEHRRAVHHMRSHGKERVVMIEAQRPAPAAVRAPCRQRGKLERLNESERVRWACGQ